jgi:hypothetical protein
VYTCCIMIHAEFYMFLLKWYTWIWWWSSNSNIVLLTWLKIIHVYVVIISLCTNICSSWIQIGSNPCMVCIVWWQYDWSQQRIPWQKHFKTHCVSQ